MTILKSEMETQCILPYWEDYVEISQMSYHSFTPLKISCGSGYVI